MIPIIQCILKTIISRHDSGPANEWGELNLLHQVWNWWRQQIDVGPHSPVSLVRCLVLSLPSSNPYHSLCEVGWKLGPSLLMEKEEGECDLGQTGIGRLNQIWFCSPSCKKGHGSPWVRRYYDGYYAGIYFSQEYTAHLHTCRARNEKKEHSWFPARGRRARQRTRYFVDEFLTIWPLAAFFFKFPPLFPKLEPAEYIN